MHLTKRNVRAKNIYNGDLSVISVKNSPLGGSSKTHLVGKAETGVSTIVSLCYYTLLLVYYSRNRVVVIDVSFEPSVTC